MLVNADDHAKTLATLAGAEGGIEGKHAIGRFAKDDAVGLEARGEMMEGPRRIETQEAFTVALVESGLNGVVQAGDGVFLVADAEAVDEEEGPGGGRRVTLLPHHLVAEVGVLLEEIFDAHHFSTHVEARESLLKIDAELLAQRTSRLAMDWRENGEACAIAISQGRIDHVFGRVALHFFATDGRDGVADTGKEQAQIVVDFGGGAHRGTRIAAADFLFDGDGGREALDIVALWLVHTSQKLTGVGRKALHITALTFGIEGVEGERGFARAGESGDDHQTVSRNGHVDVLEVVDAGTFDLYVSFFFCCHFGWGWEALIHLYIYYMELSGRVFKIQRN